MTNSIRLNKTLALSLGVSRRQADILIQTQRVKINNQIAVIGQRLHEADQLTVDDKPVETKIHLQIILLNKPVGYVCSRKHQFNDKTIYDILPTEFKSLKTAGRLDKNSSGLIVLSNNGDFIYEMTHPQFVKTKIYQVVIDHELTPLHQQMISDYGVTLPDGISKIHLEKLTDDNRLEWQAIMTEGRNRQIRRTFESLGYTVLKLHRTQFGPYSLNDLQSGHFKDVTHK